MLKPRR